MNLNGGEPVLTKSPLGPHCSLPPVLTGLKVTILTGLKVTIQSGGDNSYRFEGSHPYRLKGTGDNGAMRSL